MSRAASLPARSFGPPDPGLEREDTLANVLDGLARADPDRVAWRDDDRRESWSGRPPKTYTRAAALASVRDLSSRLFGLDLPAGSAVAMLLPAGTEACLSILAVERAGLVPVLIPVFADEADLETCIALADVRAIVTQTRVGRLRPVETAIAVAARRFRIRFLLAFGPDVPDGVVDLDHAPSRAALPVEPVPGTSPGIVTVENRAGEPRALFRPSSSWLAASAVVLAATGWQSRDTVATWIAPDDLKGLATGLVACLGSGATCELHAVFAADRLPASIAGRSRVHLVLPGWTEQAIARLGLANRAASVMLVHDGPADFSSRSGSARCPCPVVDAVSLGETALVALPRGRDGQPVRALDGSYPQGHDRELLAVRPGVCGQVDVRGWASVAFPYRSAGRLPQLMAGMWRPCIIPFGESEAARPVRDESVS